MTAPVPQQQETEPVHEPVPPVCMDCGEPCATLIVCLDCAAQRQADSALAGEPEHQWFTTLTREAKQRYPNAQWNAKNRKDGKMTATEQKAQDKPVHTSWED